MVRAAAWKVTLVIGVLVRAYGGVPVQVHAFVEKERLAVGERTRLAYRIEGEFDRFVPPQFVGVRVVGGPFQSTSVQIVNFNISRYTEYTYIVEGVQEGEWHIKGGYVEVGGERVDLPEVVIVVSGAGRPSGGGSAVARAEENMGVAWVEVRVGRKKVRVGEPVVVSYWLYSYFPVMDIAVSDVPQVANAWSYEVDLGNRIEFRRVEVGGKPYYAAEVLRRIFYPREAGVLIVDSLGLDVVVRVRVRSYGLLDEWLRSDPFFRQFFGDMPMFESEEPRQLKVSSGRVRVEVEPLPAPVPADFSGFVGELKARLRVSDTSTQVGEGITFALELQGAGNLDVLGSDIKLNFPLGAFEVYAPQVRRHRTVTHDGVRGKVLVEWVAVARQAGSYSVGVEPFSYFDPARGKYVRVEVLPVNVRVEGTTAGTPVVSHAGGMSSEATVLSPIESHTRLVVMDWRWWDVVLAGGVLFLPLVVGLALVAAGKVKRELEEVSFLRFAKDAFSSGRVEEALAHLERALYAWAQAVAKEKHRASLSKEQLAKLLAETWDGEVAAQWRGLVDRVQEARYSPVSHLKENEVRSLIKGAEELISRARKGRR